MKKGLILLILTIFLHAISFPALAFEIVYTDESPAKYGIGVELGSLGYGVSGIYNINDQVAVQGIIGVPNVFLSFSGVKLIYRFAEGANTNYYLFGAGGVVSGSPYYPDAETTGTGWAGGLGIEYSQNYLPDFIRYVTELGYTESSLAGLSSFLYFNFGCRIYFG